MPEIYNTRGDESSYVIDSTVGRSFGEEQGLTVVGALRALFSHACLLPIVLGVARKLNGSNS